MQRLSLVVLLLAAAFGRSRSSSSSGLFHGGQSSKRHHHHHHGGAKYMMMNRHRAAERAVYDQDHAEIEQILQKDVSRGDALNRTSRRRLDYRTTHGRHVVFEHKTALKNETLDVRHQFPDVTAECHNHSVILSGALPDLISIADDLSARQDEAAEMWALALGACDNIEGGNTSYTVAVLDTAFLPRRCAASPAFKSSRRAHAAVAAGGGCRLKLNVQHVQPAELFEEFEFRFMSLNTSLDNLRPALEEDAGEPVPDSIFSDDELNEMKHHPDPNVLVAIDKMKARHGPAPTHAGAHPESEPEEVRQYPDTTTECFLDEGYVTISGAGLRMLALVDHVLELNDANRPTKLMLPCLNASNPAFNGLAGTIELLPPCDAEDDDLAEKTCTVRVTLTEFGDNWVQPNGSGDAFDVAPVGGGGQVSTNSTRRKLFLLACIALAVAAISFLSIAVYPILMTGIALAALVAVIWSIVDPDGLVISIPFDIDIWNYDVIDDAAEEPRITFFDGEGLGFKIAIFCDGCFLGVKEGYVAMTFKLLDWSFGAGMQATLTSNVDIDALFEVDVPELPDLSTELIPAVCVPSMCLGVTVAGFAFAIGLYGSLAASLGPELFGSIRVKTGFDFEYEGGLSMYNGAIEATSNMHLDYHEPDVTAQVIFGAQVTVVPQLEAGLKTSFFSQEVSISVGAAYEVWMRMKFQIDTTQGLGDPNDFEQGFCDALFLVGPCDSPEHDSRIGLTFGADANVNMGIEVGDVGSDDTTNLSPGDLGRIDALSLGPWTIVGICGCLFGNCNGSQSCSGATGAPCSDEAAMKAHNLAAGLKSEFGTRSHHECNDDGDCIDGRMVCLNDLGGVCCVPSDTASCKQDDDCLPEQFCMQSTSTCTSLLSGIISLQSSGWCVGGGCLKGDGPCYEYQNLKGCAPGLECGPPGSLRDLHPGHFGIMIAETFTGQNFSACVDANKTSQVAAQRLLINQTAGNESATAALNLVLDCDGVPMFDFLSWLGDGVCDSGVYGVNLACEEFSHDGGDCPESSFFCPPDNCFSASCDEVLDYVDGVITCEALEAVFHCDCTNCRCRWALSRWDDLFDCDGNKFTEDVAHMRLGDGTCDIGRETGGPNFDCPKFNCDDGDCTACEILMGAACTDDDECSCPEEPDCNEEEGDVCCDEDNMVCMQGHCFEFSNAHFCPVAAGVCAEGDGVCRADADCAGDLVCGQSNCVDYHDLNSDVFGDADCCHVAPEVKGECDRTCRGLTCDDYTMTCATLEAKMGCDCRGCSCDVDSETCTDCLGNNCQDFIHKIGDGTCDDLAGGPIFNCAEHNCDDGDCDEDTNCDGVARVVTRPPAPTVDCLGRPVAGYEFLVGDGDCNNNSDFFDFACWEWGCDGGDCTCVNATSNVSTAPCVDCMGRSCVGSLSFVGDGYCDDGFDGPTFACEDWGCDAGDCTAHNVRHGRTNCTTPDTLFNCTDCKGNNCTTFVSWLGDGFCDDGSYGQIYFNCEDFNFDEGDCPRCPNDPENDADSDGICGEDDKCRYDPDNDKDGDGYCGNIDPCPGDVANDLDHDDICGDVDACPYDSNNDVDKDGLCANFDSCPADKFNDADSDSTCADQDSCPVDALDDIDSDNLCSDIDNCPFVANFNASHNQTDSDADGIGDACDVCAHDAVNDADQDGVCGNIDSCPFDADNDADSDAICGDVDSCEQDPENDADDDAMCQEHDSCPYDAHDDEDSDLLCADVDSCHLDAENDADGDLICSVVIATDPCRYDHEDDVDGDGICGDVDSCRYDAENDADSDLLCADVDSCPHDADDDVDSDVICGNVDSCPQDWKNDYTDSDGICDNVDSCLYDADNRDEDPANGVCDSYDVALSVYQGTIGGAASGGVVAVGVLVGVLVLVFVVRAKKAKLKSNSQIAPEVATEASVTAKAAGNESGGPQSRSV